MGEKSFLVVNIFLIFMLSFINAQVPELNLGEDDSSSGTNIILDSTPEGVTFNNNTGSVNSSDFWDNLDVPTDIPNSQFWYNHTLHTFNVYNSTWDNKGLYVPYTGAIKNVGLGIYNLTTTYLKANFSGVGAGINETNIYYPLTVNAPTSNNLKSELAVTIDNANQRGLGIVQASGQSIDPFTIWRSDLGIIFEITEDGKWNSNPVGASVSNLIDLFVKNEADNIIIQMTERRGRGAGVGGAGMGLSHNFQLENDVEANFVDTGRFIFGWDDPTNASENSYFAIDVLVDGVLTEMFKVNKTSFELGSGIDLDEGIFILPDGKVGIKTKSPTHELNVVGDTNITEDLYLGDDLFISDDLDVGGGSIFRGNISLDDEVWISDGTNYIRIYDYGGLGVPLTQGYSSVLGSVVSFQDMVQVASVSNDRPGIWLYDLGGDSSGYIHFNGTTEHMFFADAERYLFDNSINISTLDPFIYLYDSSMADGATILYNGTEDVLYIDENLELDSSDLMISQDQKICFDGSTCAHYLSYNGTCIQNGSTCIA